MPISMENCNNDRNFHLAERGITYLNEFQLDKLKLENKESNLNAQQSEHMKK